MWASTRKMTGVWHKAVRLRALPIEAEIARNALTLAPHVRRQLFVGFAPFLEGRPVQIRGPCLLQETMQRGEYPFFILVPAPKRTLPLQIPPDHRIDRGMTLS